MVISDKEIINIIRDKQAELVDNPEKDINKVLADIIYNIKTAKSDPNIFQEMDYYQILNAHWEHEFKLMREYLEDYYAEKGYNLSKKNIEDAAKNVVWNLEDDDSLRQEKWLVADWYADEFIKDRIEQLNIKKQETLEHTQKDKLIFSNEDFDVYKSSKNYDFQYYVDNKKVSKGPNDWRGFIHGEEMDFLVFCRDLRIDLPSSFIASVIEETPYSVFTIDEFYEENKTERQEQLKRDGWLKNISNKEISEIIDKNLKLGNGLIDRQEILMHKGGLSVETAFYDEDKAVMLVWVEAIGINDGNDVIYNKNTGEKLTYGLVGELELNPKDNPEFALTKLKREVTKLIQNSDIAKEALCSDVTWDDIVWALEDTKRENIESNPVVRNSNIGDKPVNVIKNKNI